MAQPRVRDIRGTGLLRDSVAGPAAVSRDVHTWAGRGPHRAADRAAVLRRLAARARRAVASQQCRGGRCRV
eukprot:365066-Chlamydomonas_euryale.AAC.10